MSNAREQQAAKVRRIRPRIAAIAAALLLAGTLTAAILVAPQASGSSTSRKVQLGLSYICAFPSGTGNALTRTPVDVTIAATFPRVATVGSRVQPTGVRMTMHLPLAAVTALRKLGASAVSSAVTLSVEASQQTTTTTTWQGQTPAAQPLPATGGITVMAPGSASPVRATSGGTVMFTAARLTLALRLTSAPGTSAASDSPSPASPGGGSRNSASPSPSSSGAASPGIAALRVACTTASGRSSTFAAVPVVAASASPRASALQSKLKLPKGCGHIKVIGFGIAVCGYITGYSDVRKLYGAALLQPKPPAPPGLVNIDFAYKFKFGHGVLIEYSTGELYYKGHHELPPVRATFLAFRFVPVTATLMVRELTPIKIVSVSGITGLPFPITVHATTTVAIGVSDVDVNGKPLAVGPHCRTVGSTRLTLIGHGDNTLPPTGYTVPTGGPLSGRLTIPAFTDCGVTENLDPLLTGSISGPRNFLLMTQGKLCGPSQPQNWTCPPPKPKPIH